MKLLIISHTPHYLKDGKVVGWGSTVKEIDQLASLFTEVIHIAPVHVGEPPESSLPYQNPKIRLALVKPAGGESWSEKISYLWRLPPWFTAMKREIEIADMVHIRCPAGISLIGLLVYTFFGKEKCCWVKYAGNWQPEAKDPLSYEFQRVLLKRNFHRGVVTVNGKWDGQPNHVISFVNPSFLKSDWQKAQISTKNKYLTTPLELIFVGRVEEEKGVGRLIQIADGLKKLGIDFHINVIGDGPRRSIYEKRVIETGMADCFSFLGWKSRMELAVYYKNAHFILLPSTASEGWPKVLSEAMAYGVVPLASNVSSIPQILEETKAGHAFPADQPQLFVDKIVQYVLDKEAWKTSSRYGMQAANLFSYETYLDSVRALFLNSWGIELIE